MRKLLVLLLLAATPVVAQAPAAAPPPASPAAAPASAPATVKGLTFTHPQAGFQVDIPDGWKTEKDGDTLMVWSADTSVSIGFITLAATDLDAAAKIMDAELSKLVQDIQTDGAPRTGKLNGLDALAVDAHGMMNGEPVQLGVVIIQCPAHVVMVFGIQTEAGKVHEATIAGIVGSIRPVAK